MERQQQVASSSVLGGRIFFGALGLLVALGLIIAFGILPSDDNSKDSPTSTVVRRHDGPWTRPGSSPRAR